MLKNPWCTAIKWKRLYQRKKGEMINSNAIADSIKVNRKGK